MGNDQSLPNISNSNNPSQEEYIKKLQEQVLNNQIEIQKIQLQNIKKQQKKKEQKYVPPITSKQSQRKNIPKQKK